MSRVGSEWSTGWHPNCLFIGTKEVSNLSTRLPVLFIVILVVLWTSPSRAAETKSAESSAGIVDTSAIEDSAAFLLRWQRIRHLTRHQAYEIQQTRTASGVRGREAGDKILDHLFYSPNPRNISHPDILDRLYYKTRN